MYQCRTLPATNRTKRVERSLEQTSISDIILKKIASHFADVELVPGLHRAFLRIVVWRALPDTSQTLCVAVPETRWRSLDKGIVNRLILLRGRTFQPIRGL